MRSVTGIVTILSFPVLTSSWGTRPLPHPATELAATLHRQFPNLQNETGAVLRASDKPARSGRQSMVLPGDMEKARKSGTRKKTRRQE